MAKANAARKRYIGDGVYVDIDDDRGVVILTTENGISVTNTIVLELEVLMAFTQYLAEVNSGRQKVGM